MLLMLFLLLLLLQMQLGITTAQQLAQETQKAGRRQQQQLNDKQQQLQHWSSRLTRNARTSSRCDMGGGVRWQARVVVMVVVVEWQGYSAEDGTGNNCSESWVASRS
jgi:hypothetical protein